MRTEQQLIDRMSDYKGAEYIYNESGYIAWQISTGENLEILFIEVTERRKGIGTTLIKDMLLKCKPYNSVFVFRLASNTEAGKFYLNLGFNENIIKKLYNGQDAVLHVANYKELCQKLLIK